MSTREIDYEGVVSFIALLREAKWHRRRDREYLSIDMDPGLVPHLPEGVRVVRRTWVGPDELMPVVLRREIGGWR